QQPVRHWWLGRRRADRLDRRQERPLPRGGDTEAGDRLDQLRAYFGRRDLLPQLLVRQAAVGRPAGLLGAFAPVAGRQREDADAGGRGLRGLPHAGERSRAVLHCVAAARRSHCAGQGTGREPWWHRGAAVAVGGEGIGDPGLVRTLSRQGRNEHRGEMIPRFRKRKEPASLPALFVYRDGAAQSYCEVFTSMCLASCPCRWPIARARCSVANSSTTPTMKHSGSAHQPSTPITLTSSIHRPPLNPPNSAATCAAIRPSDVASPVTATVK